LEYIDGLRALCALWVVVHHALESSVPEVTLRTPILGPIVASLFFGQFPVMFFLLLSGFCLYFPCVRKNPDKPVLSLGFAPYLRRRFNRIAPPYFFAGVLCLLLGTWPAMRSHGWEETLRVDTGTIVSHLLFVHNLFPQWSAKIDYPMWSIGLEWQLYLFFPLLVWAFRRSNGWVATLATLAVATVIRAGWRHLPTPWNSVMRDGPLAYLMIFALGMVAAALTVKRVRFAPSWLLGSGGALCLLGVRFSSGNGLAHDMLAAIAALLVLLAAAEPLSRLSRVLSTPWLVWLGVFSYSIYLVHAPLLQVAWVALRGMQLSPDWLCAGLLLSLPLNVLLCYGFHLLCERPFMRLAPTRPANQPAPLPNA
jgi:peptidoglycan/LPS O-acetylase OafA/YrhL